MGRFFPLPTTLRKPAVSPRGFPYTSSELEQLESIVGDGCVAALDVLGLEQSLPHARRGSPNVSVAALEAVELRRCLSKATAAWHVDSAAPPGKVVAPAWEMAVGGDLALPEVEGHGQ